METNFEVLAQAEACYAALAKFRRDRERNKRYNYGDQWCDTIEVDGRRMTEEQYIISQGSVPLKNNLIRRLVRNVIGVYSSQSSEPQCIARDPAEKPLAELMTTLLRCNGELNRLPALYMRTLEEFLIGGLIAHRKWYGHHGPARRAEHVRRVCARRGCQRSPSVKYTHCSPRRGTLTAILPLRPAQRVRLPARLKLRMACSAIMLWVNGMRLR